MVSPFQAYIMHNGDNTVSYKEYKSKERGREGKKGGKNRGRKGEKKEGKLAEKIFFISEKTIFQLYNN